MRKLDPAVVTVSSRTPQPADRCRPASLRSLVGICALYVGLAVANSSCGTTHAVLNFTAPQSATAGLPFTVTVTATINGSRDKVINSRIHFTSSDPAAVLPGDYYFTPADAGSHTWVNGFTLKTPGDQILSGEIVDAGGINGMAAVSVSP